MRDLVFITGSGGLIGSRFVEISEHKNNFHAPFLIEFDMTDASQVNAVFKSYNFSTIVNFTSASRELIKAQLQKLLRNLERVLCLMIIGKNS